MSDFRNGEHVPGHGYYSSFHKGFVSSPSQVKAEHSAPARKPSPLSGIKFRTDTITTEELRGRGNAAAFRPNPEMEALRKLRDSDRTEDRQTFQKLAAGRARMSLGSYEDNLRDYLAAGNDLPEGVAAPDSEGA